MTEPTRIEEIAGSVIEIMQQPQPAEHTTITPLGSIGWLCSSADEGSCNGTTRRTRLRHPFHAKPLSEIVDVSTYNDEEKVSWHSGAESALNRHLSLLQIKGQASAR